MIGPQFRKTFGSVNKTPRPRPSGNQLNERTGPVNPAGNPVPSKLSPDIQAKAKSTFF